MPSVLALSLAALAVLLDGFDSQAIGFAMPAILADWQLPASGLSFALVLGLVGVSAGAVIGGNLADRLGRRVVLTGAVLAFGVFSLAIGTATGVRMLALMRLLASLGLGAAMPTAISLVAELVPARRRAGLVALVVICLPLGGAVGGLVASEVLAHGGWRTLFSVGGLAAVAASLVLLALLPESPRFLVRRPARRAELLRAIVRMGGNVPLGARIYDSTEVPRVRTQLAVLFGRDLRRRTLLLWACAGFSLLALQLVVNWLPQLLVSGGQNLRVASLALSSYNVGGVFGALAFAILSGWLGLRFASLLAAGMAALVGAGLVGGAARLIGGDAVVLCAVLSVCGVFAHGLQTMLATLGVQVYPTAVRAYGAGTSAAVGRATAAVAGSYAGPLLIATGASWFFGTMCCAFLVVAAGLLLLPWRETEAGAGAA